jgi:hypothetical protein
VKKLLFVIVFILLVSCKKETKNPYVGNWYFDKVVDYDSTKTHLPKQILEIEYGPYYNFNIINDCVFDRKVGFYSSVGDMNFTIPINGRKIVVTNYLGTKTKCRLNKSSILFLNKGLKKWDTIRIKKVVGDTMIVSGYENALYKLIRKRTNYYNSTDYDAITVERSPCFGSCPFNSTYIDRKGNFYFKGYDYNEQNENFQTKLNKEEAKYYFDMFDELPIVKLNDYYLAASDGQTNTVSFFKNGKIIKTISYYIKSPIDLRKAYTALSYAYQNENVEVDNQFLFNDKVRFFSFTNKKSRFGLKDSESFFLEVALRNGKQIKTQINPKYTLEFNDWNKSSHVKNITTDGRFYKILMSDNSIKTIDIGYNFIDVNPVITKNRNY